MKVNKVSKIAKVFIRIIITAFWILIGAGVGFLIGNGFFGEGIGMWIIVAIGIIIGIFVSFSKYNWFSDSS